MQDRQARKRRRGEELGCNKRVVATEYRSESRESGDGAGVAKTDFTLWKGKFTGVRFRGVGQVKPRLYSQTGAYATTCSHKKIGGTRTSAQSLHIHPLMTKFHMDPIGPKYRQVEQSTSSGFGSCWKSPGTNGLKFVVLDFADWSNC